MFEIPEAKRVKRSQILHENDSSSDSSSGAGTPEQALQEEPDYGFEYDFISPDAQVKPTTTILQPKDSSSGQEQDRPTEEETYEFRLFTTPKPNPSTTSPPDTLSGSVATYAAKPPARISIRSPTPTSDVPISSLGRFANPHRPQSHYFTSALPTSDLHQLKAQYAHAALSGSDILARSASQKWPGTALPWRVIHIKLSSTNARDESKPTRTGPSSISTTSRPKPSKNRRILVRRRLAERATLQAQTRVQKAAALPKDSVLTEEEKEKRTRRNREKKVKRKEREKRKKAEVLAGTGTRPEGEVGAVRAVVEDDNDDGSGGNNG